MARPRTGTTHARSTRAPAPPVECQVCAHQNVPEAKFCNSCGARVDFVACGACDAINARDSSVCYSCGALLSRRPNGRAKGNVAALTPRAVPEDAAAANTSIAAVVSEVEAARAQDTSLVESQVESPVEGPVESPEAASTVEAVSAPAPAAEEQPGIQPSPSPLHSPTTVDRAMAQSPAPAGPRRRVGLWVVLGMAALVTMLAALYPRSDLHSNAPAFSTSQTVPAADAGVTGASMKTDAPRDTSLIVESPSNDAPAPVAEPAGSMDASSASPAPAAPPRLAESRQAHPATTSPGGRSVSKRQRARQPPPREAVEADQPPTSATLREQINAGSTRRVTCSQSAVALGLCTSAAR